MKSRVFDVLSHTKSYKKKKKERNMVNSGDLHISSKNNKL